MIYFLIWFVLMIVTVYFNQKANGDAEKLAFDIEKIEPDFFKQDQHSLFSDLTRRQKSGFIFMLYNNRYKKIKNIALLKRCQKVKVMSLKSMISGFILLSCAIVYVAYRSNTG